MRIEDEIKQAHFPNVYEKMVINLLFTSSWLNGHQLQWLKPHGISPQQYNILRILRGQHPAPARIQLLKERMLDKMSNVSRLVEKLRLKGLLERHTCDNDRRAVDVLITQKGLNLLTVIDKQITEGLARFHTLTPEEAHQLSNLLDKLRDETA